MGDHVGIPAAVRFAIFCFCCSDNGSSRRRDVRVAFALTTRMLNVCAVWLRGRQTALMASV